MESKSEGFPCCHTSHVAWQADGLGPLYEIKCKTIKWHVTAGGGRFTSQDLHQHFLWLPSRWLSTPWSHLNKPNFESKTLSEVLSLAQLRVRTRGMAEPTRGGRKGHKSSLKVSALLTHVEKLLGVLMWFLSLVLKTQHSPVQSSGKVSGQGCNGGIMPSCTFCALGSLEEMVRAGILASTLWKKGLGGPGVGSRCALLSLMLSSQWMTWGLTSDS